jgi:hypothetical protein
MIRGVALVLLWALYGCAGSPGIGNGAASEEALRSRASTWWQARVSGDYRTQYELQDPAFRARTSYEGYLPELIRRTRIPVKGFEITDVKQLGDGKAEVALRVTVLVRGDHTVATDQTEIWLWRDGAWFKEYQPIQTPFSRMESMGK